MGADKNSSRRRLKLQQDELARSDPQNHTLHTSTFVCQNHVAIGVLLVLGTNTTKSLNTYTHTAAKTTRESAVWRRRLDWVWGADRPPPPGNQEILPNTSSGYQNAPRFHQQNSLVKAKLATRKSWRKPKLHPGASGRLDRLPGMV
jgi:hypothetical protein